MRESLKISVFLCDGYSLSETGSVVRHLSQLGRTKTTQLTWRVHAVDPDPTPLEPLDYTPRKFHPLSESARTDLVILSLPKSDRVSADDVISELSMAGVHWRALLVVGSPQLQQAPGPVIFGSSLRSAEEALACFELTDRQDDLASNVDPLELLGFDADSLSPVVIDALRAMGDSISSPLAIEDLSRTLDINPRQLHRRFTQEIGEAPLATYRKIRVEMGRRLLEQTDTPITTIAHNCGFSDGPHFARSFKKLHRYSPQIYRNKQSSNTGRIDDGLKIQLTVVGVENHSYKCLNVLEEFSRRVLAASNSQIHIRVISHLDLGIRSNQILNAVDQGAVDAALVIPEMMVEDPHFASLLPQGVLHSGQLNRQLREVQEPIILEALNRHGLTMLANMSDYEYQNFWFFSRRPIKSSRELKHQSLGHWSDLGTRAFKSLDVDAHKIRYGAIHESFNRTDLDVVLGLPRFAVSNRLAEIAPYATPAMAVTRHYPSMIATTHQTLNKLPHRHQEIIRQVGNAMQLESELKWQSGVEDERSLSALKQGGMTFMDRFKRSELIDIESSMLDSWISHCNSLGNGAKRSCDAIRSVLSH